MTARLGKTGMIDAVRSLEMILSSRSPSRVCILWIDRVSSQPAAGDPRELVSVRELVSTVMRNEALSDPQGVVDKL